jgi:GNAT superfamily N-acetyltransferase
MRASEFICEIALGPDDPVDVYIRGKHRGNTITRLVARNFPNKNIPLLIRKLETKHGVNPNAVVYGPSQIQNENFADGKVNSKINFTVQSGGNKFATTMTVDGEPAGVYQYNADTGRSIAEVYPEYRGKGLGKILVLHAIYTATKLGMDFIEDESRTSEYDNVLDSLSDNGYIVDDDGYWYVTSAGEQFLKDSLNENFADGKVKGKSRPGRARRAGVNCKQSISKLRSIAKNSSGERQRMAHWCANMKSGRNK